MFQRRFEPFKTLSPHKISQISEILHELIGGLSHLSHDFCWVFIQGGAGFRNPPSGARRREVLTPPEGVGMACNISLVEAGQFLAAKNHPLWAYIYIYIYMFIFIRIYVYIYIYLYIYLFIYLFIEGNLEVKLPRIWTDEKQRWEESEKRREEKKKEDQRRDSQKKDDSRCAKR